jgi:hypothetical protein
MIVILIIHGYDMENHHNEHNDVYDNDYNDNYDNHDDDNGGGYGDDNGDDDPIQMSCV